MSALMTTTTRSTLGRLTSRLFLVTAATSLALSLTIAAPALAQGQGTKIGFVNTERILRDSVPAKAAQTKIENEFKKRAEELEKQVNNLRGLAQKLEKDAPVLSESERNKRQRELANIDADLQRKRREIQEDSSRRRNEEFATIIEIANAAIKKIAETENYDIVIQDAVTVNPRVDITDKVIQALSK